MIAAEAAFRARLGELGAVLLEPWHGAMRPHRVRCAAGHECSPRPAGVTQGQGVCPVCARNDPAAAEAAFRARLGELGAVLLEPWHGAMRPHRVRCAAGHECSPRPGNVMNGAGPCRLCAGKVWDAFYVVADRAAARIKFGITSGDPRPRLRTHRAGGYGEIVRLMAGLPASVAPELEAAALAALTLAGFRPVRGREYYDASALPVVLDIADHYPGAPQATRAPASAQ